MRLLPKKLANAEVATQRKQQIEEGLILSRKIDKLRETLAEEEQKLERFRTETVKRVKEEINQLIAVRDALVKIQL